MVGESAEEEVEEGMVQIVEQREAALVKGLREKKKKKKHPLFLYLLFVFSPFLLFALLLLLSFWPLQACRRSFALFLARRAHPFSSAGSRG